MSTSKTCKICGKEITSWQSYHISGVGVFHGACEYGRTPPASPTSYFHTGDKIHATSLGQGIQKRYHKRGLVKEIDVLRIDPEDDKRITNRARQANGQYAEEVSDEV
jgi:hypothetical protein